jgi:hypothetical protein
MARVLLGKLLLERYGYILLFVISTGAEELSLRLT